ncbi:carbon-nitrogen hydrolase family protein [bacterium]|nr:carbon-nitrogen hydrolase family protein [bacterium]
MISPFVAAALQMNSGAEKSANLAQAEAMIAEAASQGARLVVLPELFPFLGKVSQLRENAESMDGKVLRRMRELAIEHQLVLCAGSMAFPAEGDPLKVVNRSIIFGPHGQTLATYDKIHCFDINLPEVHVVESDYVRPGSHLSVASTPLGHIGQAICYDLRFPEIFRRLTVDGMQICVLPSAFTAKTGQAHWEVLVRARAIENQIYIVAANQCGVYADSIPCFGNSLIVDPWGKILARGDCQTPGVVSAEIDLAYQRKIRTELPALTHRQMI